MQINFKEIILCQSDKKNFENLTSIGNNFYSNREAVNVDGLDIIFTGYLFNFKSIKEIKHTSVEEVVAEYYLNNREEELIEKLEGYYSVVVIEGSTITILMDKYGVESGYYVQNNFSCSFVFSTSLELLNNFFSLQFELEYLASFLIFPSMPFDFTLYKHVKSLRRGEHIYYNERVVIRKYNYLNSLLKGMNEMDGVPVTVTLSEIEKTLIASLGNLREESKGFDLYNQLSGGVDSSFIQVLLNKIGERNSYCYNLKGYGRDKEYSEDIARILKCNHRVFDISTEVLLNYNKDAISFLKLPQVAIGESMMNFSFHQLSEMKKPVISICGNGSDALFCHGRELKILKAYDKKPHITKGLIKRLSPYSIKFKKVLPLIQNYSNLTTKDILEVFGNSKSIEFIESRYLNLAAQRKSNSLYSFPGRLIDKRYLMRVFEGEVSEQNKIYYKMSKRKKVLIYFPMIKDDIVKLLMKVPIEKKLKYYRNKYLVKRYLKNKIPSKYINRKKIGKNTPWDKILSINNKNDIILGIEGHLEKLVNIEELKGAYGHPGYEDVSLKAKNINTTIQYL